MSAYQSQFSKLPKKQLVFISEKLIDEDFPIGNPYNDDFENAYRILQTISKYFSIEATQEDVEFFSKFLELNDEIIADLFANNREQMKNKELIERLVIPVAKTYEVDYNTWGTCTYTEYLRQDFDCYDEEWVRDSASQQDSDGSWSTWDGSQRHPPDYENFEQSDYSFEEVHEKRSKNESMLDKLVIENTTEVVNSLDKRTLLELRRIIDSKLRLL